MDPPTQLSPPSSLPLLAPSGYFTWIKWSYLEKLRHERRGVVLGLPVCRRLGDMDPQERYPTAQMAEVAGDGAADRVGAARPAVLQTSSSLAARMRLTRQRGTGGWC